MNRAQLDLFRERLPRKPYHTDEFTTGLSIADVSRALGARYIQPNGPTHRHWLVFDVDHAAATLSWDDVGAPAPNITVTNRANGHAHLIYGLETPIRTAPDGKVAPLRYAAAIEAALREKLGADLGYSGLICKNPLHTHWLVQVWEPASYDLSWLADYLVISAIFRAFTLAVDRPWGDPLLTSIDHVARGKHEERRGREESEAREQAQRPVVPDQILECRKFAGKEADYVIVASRRKDGWTRATTVLANSVRLRIGEPLEKILEGKLRTCYPLRVIRDIQVDRRMVHYEWPEDAPPLPDLEAEADA